MGACCAKSSNKVVHSPAETQAGTKQAASGAVTSTPAKATPQPVAKPENGADKKPPRRTTTNLEGSSTLGLGVLMVKQPDHRNPHQPVASKSDTSTEVRWRNGNLIGTGTLGPVYYGELEGPVETRVAVKIIQLVGEPGAPAWAILDDLIEEVRALSEYEDTNIVRYYGTARTKDCGLQLVSEYVEGESLAVLLQQHNFLSDGVATAFTFQITTGLAFLHAQGVVHGNLKPANILVTAQPSWRCKHTLKIADFAGNRDLLRFTTMCEGRGREPLGSANYMAPEVIVTGAVGKPADIWALGTIAIEMMSGLTPVGVQPPLQAMLTSITRTNPPAFPATTTIFAADFLLNCFTRDPSKRAKTDTLKKHPWFANMVQRSSSNIDMQRKEAAAAMARSRANSSSGSPTRPNSIHATSLAAGRASQLRRDNEPVDEELHLGSTVASLSSLEDSSDPHNGRRTPSHAPPNGRSNIDVNHIPEYGRATNPTPSFDAIRAFFLTELKKPTPPGLSPMDVEMRQELLDMYLINPGLGRFDSIISSPAETSDDDRD